MAGSVLETFYILFESDAEDVKKGAKEAKNPVDQLEDSLQSADTQATEFGESFNNLAKTAVGAFAAVFAVTSLLSQSSQIVEQTDNLAKFSRAIGENVGEVQAWTEAVVRAGGEVSGFESSIEQLNEKVVDAAVKGFNEVIPFFNQLGISIVDVNGKTKSTLQLLPELAESFEKLTEGQALGFGRKLGLDRGTVLLLMQGREEVEKLVERQRQLGVVSDEQARAVEAFVDQWADFKQLSTTIARGIIVSLIPTINDILRAVEKFTFFLMDNENLVTGFFVGLGTVISVYLLPQMAALAKWTILVAAPFLLWAALIGGVIAAIALLYDDMVAFMNGNDSVIEQVIKQWNSFIDTIMEAINAVKEFFGSVEGDSGLDRLIRFFGVGPDDAVRSGQALLGQAGATPLNGLNSQSIANQTSNRSQSVQNNFGDINIQPQTPGDIPASTGESLQTQIKSAVNVFDDGLDS